MPSLRLAAARVLPGTLRVRVRVALTMAMLVVLRAAIFAFRAAATVVFTACEVGSRLRRALLAAIRPLAVLGSAPLLRAIRGSSRRNVA